MENKVSRYLLALSLLLMLHIRVQAQDTPRVLRVDAFMNILRNYHPVLKQAAMSVEIAESKIMQARGAFDPSVNANINSKTFEAKEYYNYRSTYLDVPTWYGIGFKTGIENVTGDRITSEATPGTTTYAGVKLSANELIFDKRRAVLRQAKAYWQLSEAEQKLIVNDLLYEGLTTYWDWLRDYRIYQVITKAVQNNEQRLRFIKIEYEQGARPAIDTTEAIAQLQTFYLQQNEALLKLNNSGLKLSNFLWLENDTPYPWDNQILPDTTEPGQSMNLPSLNELIDTIAEHPKLRMIERKIDIISVEKLLARQSFIPKLSVSGSLLNRNFDIPAAVDNSFIANNHKASVDVSIPLLQRYARGKYRETKLQLSQTKLEKNNTQLQLENKLKMHYNELLAIESQVSIFLSAVNNYKTLLNGEQTKFEMGESSLFLLNSRQSKWLEASQKLIELEVKYVQKKAAVLWAAGIWR